MSVNGYPVQAATAGADMCWLNGQLMPAAEARVPVQDHGLLYGDGVFEGVRFYGRRPFRLGAHLERLGASARAIDLALPYPEAVLTEAVTDTIAAQPLEDGYLRVVATRGCGPLGVDPRGCRSPTVFILSAALTLVPPEVAARGIRVVIAGVRRLGVDGLDPRIKSLNYLNHVLARQQAAAAGADEAILLNGAGAVAEASTENVFVVRRGGLATPPVTDGALDGITRGVVLELARESGLPATEMSLAPYDLYTADEVFLSGTGAELLPVREVDGRTLPGCPGPVFRQIRQAFRVLVRRETGAHGRAPGSAG